MNNLWQTLGKVKGGKDVSLSDGFGSNPFKGSLHLSPVSLFMRFSSVKPFHNLNINLVGKVCTLISDHYSHWYPFETETESYFAKNCFVSNLELDCTQRFRSRFTTSRSVEFCEGIPFRTLKIEITISVPNVQKEREKQAKQYLKSDIFWSSILFAIHIFCWLLFLDSPTVIMKKRFLNIWLGIAI